MFEARYVAEWSPSATSNLQSECDTGDTAAVAYVDSKIPFPTMSNHTNRGSVNVLEPASANADFDVNSCKTSDAAANKSSGNVRSRSAMSKGIRDVKSLMAWWARWGFKMGKRTYSPLRKGIHAWRHLSAARYWVVENALSGCEIMLVTDCTVIGVASVMLCCIWILKIGGYLGDSEVN